MRFSTVRRNRYAAASAATVLGGSCRSPASSGNTVSNERVAQLRPAAAAHDLKRLHDELDLADAAGAELDVLGHVLARDFLRDEALHLPQRVEHAVVEVAAIDERREDIVEDVGSELDPREQARLDVRVSLPIAAVLDQVRFERGEPDRERPARAERAQAHVDAIREAVLGALIEQLDEELRRGARSSSPARPATLPRAAPSG